MTPQISAIGTAVPKYKINQKELALNISELMCLDSKTSRVLNAMLRFSGIESRYSVLSDFSSIDANKFYEIGNSPTTSERMEVYLKEAYKLAIQSIEDCAVNYEKSNNRPLDFAEITDLIIVSCTGMYSPGIELEIIKRFNLKKDINKTLIQFMGCCAAFNGLKTADAFCNLASNRKCLLVCIELSTIHFQYENNDDNLRANVLFSDGASCAFIETSDSNRKSLKMQNFNSLYVYEASEDMSWKITNNGFKMKLSETIPDLITANMDDFLTLFKGLDSEKYQLAIHPGGVKILQAVEKYFNITPDKIKYSYEVLKKYGNMSSATILFVLKEILYSKDNVNEDIFACAFGPGITFEGAVFKLN